MNSLYNILDKLIDRSDITTDVGTATAAVTIAAGATGSQTYSLTKTGYQIIGLVSLAKAGAGTGTLGVASWSYGAQNDIVTVYYVNAGTASRTLGNTSTCTVLMKKA